MLITLGWFFRQGLVDDLLQLRRLRERRRLIVNDGVKRFDLRLAPNGRPPASIS